MKQASLSACARLVLLAAVAGVAACHEAGLAVPSAPAEGVTRTRGASGLVDFAQFTNPPRKQTPWQAMADRELAAAVSQRGGRVIIGVREPGSMEGVTQRGQVLASRQTVQATEKALRVAGLKIERVFDGLPIIVARLSVASAERIRALRAMPQIDYVEPDVLGGVSSEFVPWNIVRVQGPSAWSMSRGEGVKLLIVDTGVGSHQDVQPAVQFRCIDQSEPPTDEIGHGTGVAGVAAAVANGVDVMGLSYGISLWSADVMVAGTTDASAAELACAIDVARVNGVFSVNISVWLPAPSTAVNDAISVGYYGGMFFAAAAGNNGYFSGALTYPATLAEVVAVAAVDSAGAHAAFSSYGPKVELSAPGVAVVSTAMPNVSIYPANLTATLGTMDGTSVASPHVAAAAAILKSRNLSWTNVDIRARLNATAQYLGDPSLYGNGLLRVYNALVY